MELSTSTAQANMLAQQLRATGVLEAKVLDVFAALPREAFLPPHLQGLAYAESHLPIGHGQVSLTASEQAHIVQALALQAHERVCEIGTGTGFLTAVLARSAQQVTSYDVFIDFTQSARTALETLNIRNVELMTDDAQRCWEQSAPYDAIVITASLPQYPESYKRGLTVGGRLFAIVGTGVAMQALLITRVAQETWSEKVLFNTEVPAMLPVAATEAFLF